MSGNKRLNSMNEAPIWSVPVDASEVPESGLHVELEANESVRRALAELCGVNGLPKIHVSFDLARKGAGVRVTGRVSAQVVQTCVVTLEPLTNTVDEAFDLVFLPGAAESASENRSESGEEQPEPLVHGQVDLGAIATEFLMLGIDPYPRKPGAIFVTPKSDDQSVHPFAALAALKKGPGGRQS